MSLFHRLVPDDGCERTQARAAAVRAVEDTERLASGSELIRLADFLRDRNQRNHYAARLREAYGQPKG